MDNINRYLSLKGLNIKRQFMIVQYCFNFLFSTNITNSIKLNNQL